MQQKLISANIKLGKIAAVLNITNAAATDMAKKLAARKLVNYTKYKPLTLTQKGNEIALNVIRKHRLWESFLYETLNLSLHEIHREAEILEHLTSDFLADKISKYLGNPSTDPHGDPIPAINGKIIPDKTQLLLSEASAGHNYTVCRLSGIEEEFFDFCSSNHITVGSIIWIAKQYSVNKMTEIKIKTDKILLNYEFANLIYVKQVQNKKI
ncbi:MAG: metal-dependent transcriptional regulator [Bacteroidales bacterium]|nr:metal-dependent transcriptional regulator [Bacteroidales bacterium]